MEQTERPRAPQWGMVVPVVDGTDPIERRRALGVCAERVIEAATAYGRLLDWGTYVEVWTPGDGANLWPEGPRVGCKVWAVPIDGEEPGPVAGA